MVTGVLPLQSRVDMWAPCSEIILARATDRTKCKGVMQETRNELAMNAPEVMSSTLVLHTASLFFTLLNNN